MEYDITKMIKYHGDPSFIPGEEVFEINEYGCSRLTYHEPRFKGDAHYVDVEYEGKLYKRIFEPNEIYFDEDIYKT